MTERYIPGVPCWVDACYPDPEAAAEFYTGLFGWDCQDSVPDEVPGHYIQGHLDGERVAAVSSMPPDMDPVIAWNSYIWVDSADETTEKAVAAGATVIMEPDDVPGAGRLAMLVDPQGAAFGVWQAAEHRGATKVNDHGAVNFNDLYTTDIEGAKAFYGEVFGWGVTDVGGALFWTMPAYGDHLESLQPGLRAQMAEFGAPGFENVVATLSETDGSDPARWGVTFATTDVAATTKLAAELGATIVSEPADAPWVRFAVIEDPQGAVFTASQFVPENAQPAT